jgi:hypothetical protein
LEGIGQIGKDKWDSWEFIVLLLEKFDGVDWWHWTLGGSISLYVKWDE